jgi:soluble lytic murein transglycosylase
VALVTYLRHDYRRAALAFDSLRAPGAGGGEANAAGYWSGRAWTAAKDTARARISWLDLVARVPESYYATESARRIGAPLPSIPAAAARPSVAAPSRIADAEGRIGWLRRAGLDQEAQWEVDALGAWAGDSDTLLAAAAALSRLDEPALAARLARMALTRGAADSALAAHLLYPLDAGEVLVHEARTQGLDPAFAAALIRQESGFDAEAVSGAGARGLMQVMPDVGASLARRLHFPTWDPVLLFQPDVNLELGMAHLRQLFDRLKDPVRVLAAYNAGASRVKVWGSRRGVDDPDVFIERIPFAETRDYVRTVLRNREVYRALYGW